MKKNYFFAIISLSSIFSFGQTLTGTRLRLGNNPITYADPSIFIRPTTNDVNGVPIFRMSTNGIDDPYYPGTGSGIFTMDFKITKNSDGTATFSIGPTATSAGNSTIPNKFHLAREGNTQVAIGRRFSITNPTKSPFATGFLLSINGKAIAEEIQVQVWDNWPDYVFKEDYKLLPIPELEKYINQNSHLPNIPSAEEVNLNDGIMLGEMNRKLLEKVEELHLYIIALNKKIEELEKKVNDEK